MPFHFQHGRMVLIPAQEIEQVVIHGLQRRPAMLVVDRDLQVVSDGLLKDDIQDRIRPVGPGVVPPGHGQGINQSTVHLLHMLFNDGWIPGIVGADQGVQALQAFLPAPLCRRLDPVVLAEPDVVIGQNHLVRESKAPGSIGSPCAGHHAADQPQADHRECRNHRLHRLLLIRSPEPSHRAHSSAAGDPAGGMAWPGPVSHRK